MLKPALVAAILLAAAAPARAGGTAVVPVCAQPEVLVLLNERLARAGDHSLIEPESVGEVDGAGDIVRCSIRVHSPLFDTNRLGREPVDVARTYQYALRVGRNGVFMLPTP